MVVEMSALIVTVEMLTWAPVKKMESGLEEFLCLVASKLQKILQIFKFDAFN
jgi:hypothetical protein